MRIEAEIKNSGGRVAKKLSVRFFTIMKDKCGNFLTLSPESLNVPSPLAPDSVIYYQSPSMYWTIKWIEWPSYLVYEIEYKDDLPFFLRMFEKETYRSYRRWDNKREFPLVLDVNPEERKSIDKSIDSPQIEFECEGEKITGS